MDTQLNPVPLTSSVMSSLAQEVSFMHLLKTDHFNEVLVEAMPDRLRSIATHVVKPKQCYNNCFKLAQSLPNSEIHYVLGFTKKWIPIEHAFLKVDGVYYDPTLEIISEVGKSYLSMIEIPHHQLINVVDAIYEREGKYYPPMIKDCQYLEQYQHLFQRLKWHNQ